MNKETQKLLNKKTSLNGEWILSCIELDCQVKGNVPGSVYDDLMQASVIPDPFDQDNEYMVREYMNHDYAYEREFQFDYELISRRKNFLVFEGIDTLGEVYLNGILIANTDNMHRTYRFPIDDVLQSGKNKIKVVLKSPLQYIKEKEEACPYTLYQASDSVKGYIHLRKGSSMFGWDWGPQLPDAGIWRDVYIESITSGHIEDVLISQRHLLDEVVVNINIDLSTFVSKEELSIDVQLAEPQGFLVCNHKNLDIDDFLELNVKNPKKWYPVGYGEQNFYLLTITLKHGEETVEEKQIRFGLKEILLEQVEDQYGESFTFVVNGIPFFGKGANYIPEDNLLSRTNKEKTRALLEAALQANHNMIRVWGGGIYPNDYFFDLCDEMGILIWQDLMFACSIYNMEDTELVETMKQEIVDNLKRIRNHPSIALICGNNENEMAIEYWNVPSLDKSKKFYKQQYTEIIPELVNKHFPDVAYWRSSPASKELFKDSNADGYGDMHYWGVWHNNEPITWYRKYFPRFMSEFGLQSFPELKTIQSFAREEDYNIFSYILEQHQKNKTANSKILNYVGKMFKYPKDFESLLLVSQLIQAEGIRYGVEHWRRNYGRCMGILYWQLNDCWPVASWSSIDYFHRWKALHYHSKKFYNPLLVSIEEIKNTAKIHLTNDLLEYVSGTLEYQLMDFSGNVILENQMYLTIKPQSAKFIKELKFHHKKREYRNLVLHASFSVNDEVVTENTVSFVPDKYLELKRPNIEMHVENCDEFCIISLKSDTYAKYVEVKIEGEDNIFSDNYFNLLPNRTKIIKVNSTTNLLEHQDLIKVRTLTDTY